MVDLDARLDRAATRVAGLFTTLAEARLDPPGLDDDVLNETTGDLTPPVEDATALWTGLCAISPANRVPNDAGLERLGPVPPLDEEHYIGRFPLTAPLFSIGVIIAVTESRDPSLIGREFRVSTDTPPDSFAVLRTVPLEAL